MLEQIILVLCKSDSSQSFLSVCVCLAYKNINNKQSLYILKNILINLELALSFIKFRNIFYQGAPSLFNTAY